MRLPLTAVFYVLAAACMQSARAAAPEPLAATPEEAALAEVAVSELGEASYGNLNKRQLVHLLTLQSKRHNRLLWLVRILLASGYVFVVSAVALLAKAGLERSSFAAGVLEQRAEHEKQKEHLQNEIAKLQSRLQQATGREDAVARKIEDLRRLAGAETERLKKACEQAKQQQAQLQEQLLKHEANVAAMKEIIQSVTDKKIAAAELESRRRQRKSEKEREKERQKAEKERQRQEKEKAKTERGLPYKMFRKGEEKPQERPPEEQDIQQRQQQGTQPGGVKTAIPGLLRRGSAVWPLSTGPQAPAPTSSDDPASKDLPATPGPQEPPAPHDDAPQPPPPERRGSLSGEVSREGSTKGEKTRFRFPFSRDPSKQ